MLSIFQSIDPFAQPVLLPRPALGLHAMVVSAGFESARPGTYEWHGLKRGKAEFVIFQYTLRGQGHLIWEGKDHTVPVGSAMVLHFPHDNRYWLPKGGTWDFFYICMNGREVLRLWQAAVKRLGPVIGLPDTSSLLQTAVSTCLRVHANQIPTAWEASTLAYDLAVRLAEHALPSRDTPSRNRRPEPVVAAIEYCHENLHRQIGVEDLAEQAGLSRYHFTRVFQAAEGIAPGEYITRERMRRAARLLQEGRLAVKQVAQNCGYNDPSYFCKAFRKAFGVSPGAFRRSGMV